MQLRLAEMSALAVVALLVLSATVPGMVAGAGISAAEQNPALSTANEDLVSADTFINSSQNVSVWERAGLPLRVDTGNAVTTVDGPTTLIYTNETGDAPLNKDTFGVFETGSTISLDFESRTGAGTQQFDGQEVQLVAARVADDPDTSNLNGSTDTSLTATEAIDRLLSQNRSAAEVNRNFTFTVADTGQVQNGQVSTNFTPSEPGTYAFMLVASDTGQAVSVSNGNATLSEDVRVLGVDAAPVQAASASATPTQSTVEPGENVTFELDSNLNDEGTTHAVMLINESKLSDQTTRINIDGDLETLLDQGTGADLSSDNVTIDHSIDAIEGVGRVDSGTQVMGIELAAQSERTVSLPGLIQFVADSAGQDAPKTVSTDDVVLNASASVIMSNDTATVDVGTSANWSEGTYTYVYVASTNDTDEFSTDKGQVTIAEPSQPKPPKQVQLNLSANKTSVRVDKPVRLTLTRPNGNPLSGFQLSNGGTSVNVPTSELVVSFDTPGTYTLEAGKQSVGTNTYLNDSVTIEVKPRRGGGGGGGGGGGQAGGGSGGSASPVATGNGATVNYRNIRGGQTVSVQVPNVASENAAVTGLDFTPTFLTGDFRVEFTKPQAGPPSGTPELNPAQGTAVSYFTAEAFGINDDEITEVNFTFTLSESELGDRAPENVRLFRYHDGEWVTLETTHLGGNEFRARSPGFTAYAIGFQSEQADLSVTEASLGTDTVNVDEEVTISATVENTGGESGSITLELTANGETVTTREVTVDAGASETFEFQGSFSETGEYDIAVNDVSAGTLTVEETTGETTATATPDDTPTDTPDDDSGGVGAGMIIAILLVLLAIGGGVYFYTQQQ